jgi:hypothetical protein
VRQGQQNRRGRGRNNNRKGQHHHNPLSRSFESNGPDVKIRGTPAHIAEKYLALARDAQSSGDPVLAENYLQHAEHYSRIIMAYRDQLNPQGAEGLNGNSHRMRNPGEMGDGGDDYGDEEGADGAEDAFGHPFSQPQPQQPMRQDSRQDTRQDARPDQNPRHDGNRPDRPFRRDRDQGRHRERFNDRGPERDRGPDRERPAPPEARPQSPDRQTEQSAETPADSRRRDRFQQPHEQPEFLRRPVRRVRSEVEEVEKDETSRD